MPDIAITGFGCMTASGRGVAGLVTGPFTGEHLFKPIERFATDGLGADVAATMPGQPDLTDALCECIADALGMAGAIPSAETPLVVSNKLAADENPAALASEVAIRCGLSAGPTVANACTGAATALIMAARMILLGRAETVVVAGGSIVDRQMMAEFDASRVLSKRGLVSPCDVKRDGVLLGDAVAAVVLESAAAARRRGPAVLAVLAGWGEASDAEHLVQPSASGRGMATAISRALDRADLPHRFPDHVNIHGTATALNDVSEARAIRTVWGESWGSVPCSGTKSAFGHGLEGGALIEVLLAIQAHRLGTVPATVSVTEVDPECGLNVAGQPRQVGSVSSTLSLNSAVGGVNTALVIQAVTT
jgi:3-oxoacyl-[acyl-carrier-protein] synthase II